MLTWTTWSDSFKRFLSVGFGKLCHGAGIANCRVLSFFHSRAHSPALGVHSFSGVQRFNISSHNQSPKRHSISHSPSSNSNGSFLAPETEPIVPELCIDHLWTEPMTNIRFGVCLFIWLEVLGSIWECFSLRLAFFLISIIHTRIYRGIY